jgi:hypothetical protein
MKQFDHSFTLTVRSPQKNTKPIQQQLSQVFRQNVVEPIRLNPLDIKEAPLTFYPDGDIIRLRVEFAKPVSKDQAEKIVGYWKAPKYIGTLDSIDWNGGTTMVLHVDFTQSGSRDWRKHNVLEELLKYLEEGSPVRQSDGQRAVEGFGANSVVSVVGYDE